MAEGLEFLGVGILVPRQRLPLMRSSRALKAGSRSIQARVVVSGGGEVFSVTSSSKSEVDYLGESTKGDLNVSQERLDALGEKFSCPRYK